MHISPIALQHEDVAGLSTSKLQEHVLEKVESAYTAKNNIEEPEKLKKFERHIIIRSIDHNWQDHLTEMEDLRRSVGLRGYGQKDPLSEYKSEAYVFFEKLMRRVRKDMCTRLFRSTPSLKKSQEMLYQLTSNAWTTGPGNDELSGRASRGEGPSLPKITIKHSKPKVRRNDSCPCGSGKKYKKCCGTANAS